MQDDVRLFDSITDAKPDAAGCIAVSGSHGGLYAAAVASRAGLRAVILNDAGRGLNDAGIAGVRALADVGMAACAVDCMSAEIGSASDAAAHGIISYANPVAADLGITPGQTARAALDLLAHAPTPRDRLAEVPEARWDEDIDGTPVLCVDSASLITPDDAGRIIVTGSHGGLIGGNPARACKAQALYVSFSDAGRGKNDIGLTRLPALDARGIAAATLDCMSCEIGNAASALANGIVSAANRTARDLGLRVGMAHADALRAIIAATRG
ncbi:hypothetical protein [Marimonas lutisalis]|uniref:hypothetical protein n=1 Tax=Marimonas lutisalis TaxID=2545756 RepID=UPI0010F888C1|nr:hypothetical protein [Marimonas lutisalis]